MAWLYAAPKPDKRPVSNKDEVTPTRIEKMKVDGLVPQLPPLSTPWLVEYLMEIGPIVSTGMGAGPIGWRDIIAWQECTGNRLQPWEARLLRRLSSDYLVESREAEKIDRPAPMADDDSIQANRDAVSRQFKIAMTAYKMAKEKKR